MDSTKTYQVALDIGNNATSLLEKLAAKLGLTAQQLFPYYVKQQVISAYSSAASTLAALIIGIFLFTYFRSQAEWRDGNWQCGFTIVGFVLMLIGITFSIGGINWFMSHIINPEYGAIHQIMYDVGNIR